MPLKAGTQLGDYEILSPLGAGGMGEVYRARDTQLDREVAIKVLPEKTANDPVTLSRFEREAKAVAALSHPNILSIHHIGKEKDIVYVVLELLEGETLRDHIRGSPIPWRDAVEMGMAITDGLAAAHNKGIIHRDLKPENIFLTSDGLIKILDFGLAHIEPVTTDQSADETPTLTLHTRPGAVMGTIHYMSPEQVRGLKTDARSDIFSLGCVLYEMVTGKRAFSGKTDADTITAILREQPASMSSTVKDVTPGLDRVISRCLEKQPAKRIQSARDVGFALRDVLTDSRTSSTTIFTGLAGRKRVFPAILVIMLAIFGSFYLWKTLSKESPMITAPIDSIAVLPLENLSGDPEQDYFVDGITEALIMNLAKIKALKVISRTSAMHYKGTDKTLPQIARELNVRGIVEGSVILVGNQVRVTAQLIHAASDTHLWADSYTRELRDILSLQNDIARAIAEQIKVQLTPQEQQRLASARPMNPQAHDAYLKGRYHWNKWTNEGFEKAVDYYQDAIEIDPTFALAYMGLSAAYNTLGFFGGLPPADALLKSKEAVLRALDMDQTLGEAHAILGMNYLLYEWDFSAAEQAFKRAVQFSPNNPTVHHAYMVYFERMGRMDEALKEIKRAHELDPLSLMIIADVGAMNYSARRYDTAIEYFKETISLDPNFVTAHEYLGLAYLQQRKYDQAIAELERATRLSSRESLNVLAQLGYAYAASGQTTEARKLLEELNERSTQEYVSPYAKATIYIGLGEKDEAFAWLERAYEERAGLVSFKTDPLFDPLRDDPRFDDLLRRIGFEVEEKPDELDPKKSQSNVKLPADKTPDYKIMLAVLPFKNLGLAEDEYFADGISDEIRSRLAAVRKLGVISRSSAFQYKNTNKPNRQIGSELGVDYLIDGTIRWDKRGGGAGRVRITPELIRISDDLSLWSQSYNRVLEDIFEVQSDIAVQVIKQLKITLLEPERQAIEVIPTESTDAYRAYLLGKDYMGRPDNSEEDFRLAIQMFERAVNLDPSFALAYAQLSTIHSRMHHWGYDRTEARVSRARAAVDRALELQPDLPEAYLALGYYHYYCYRDYDRALEALAIAEKNLPNDSRILEVVGYIWRRQGRFEDALDNLKRAFDLSPLDAGIVNNIAGTYRLLRRYPEVERWCDRSIFMAPDQVVAYLEKAEMHWLWHGDTDMARATLEEMPQKNTPGSIFGWFRQELFERNYQAALDRIDFPPAKLIVMQGQLISNGQLAGLVYQLLGEPGRAREAYDSARILLEEEIKKRPDDHRVRSSLGIVYSGLGRKEDAIREGKLGVELFPVSKDAIVGPYRVEDLAFIYTLVGEYDAALDKLEYLLSIPCETMSVPMLKLDPHWDPLRNHPRYLKLIE